jgi:hypothetical protein
VVEVPAAVVVVGPSTVKLLSVPPTAGVRIDGRELSPTPLKVELQPGRHLVEMSSGGASASFWIDVDAEGDNKWCYAFGASKSYPGSCPR